MRKPFAPDELAALRALWEAFGRHEQRRRAEGESQPAPTDAELLARRIEESRDDAPPLCRIFLGTAVPLWIDKMRWWREAYRIQKAHELGEEIAQSQSLVADEHPEGRVGRGELGTVGPKFNQLAQGLALLAFCPGGVVFAGYHWQAEPGRLPADPEEASP